MRSETCGDSKSWSSKVSRKRPSFHCTAAISTPFSALSKRGLRRNSRCTCSITLGGTLPPPRTSRNKKTFPLPHVVVDSPKWIQPLASLGTHPGMGQVQFVDMTTGYRYIQTTEEIHNPHASGIGRQYSVSCACWSCHHHPPSRDDPVAVVYGHLLGGVTTQTGLVVVAVHSLLLEPRGHFMSVPQQVMRLRFSSAPLWSIIIGNLGRAASQKGGSVQTMGTPRAQTACLA